MKIVIVLAVALATVEAFRFSSIIDAEWSDFKINYGKRYVSPDVELVRKLIFASALYKIGRHNEKYVKGLVNWTMGIDQFTDLVDIEIPTGLIMPGQDPDAVLRYVDVASRPTLQHRPTYRN